MLKFISKHDRQGDYPMTSQNIPKATAKRLPIYYRYLNMLSDAGKNASVQMNWLRRSKLTLRLSAGTFLILEHLENAAMAMMSRIFGIFQKTLNQDKLTNVALIGVGNLGHALLNFNFHKSNNVRINAAFDINEEITGTIQSGVPIYPMEDMKEQLKIQQIEIVILTVPANVAQGVTNDLIEVGVKEF